MQLSYRPRGSPLRRDPAGAQAQGTSERLTALLADPNGDLWPMTHASRRSAAIPLLHNDLGGEDDHLVPLCVRNRVASGSVSLECLVEVVPVSVSPRIPAVLLRAVGAPAQPRAGRCGARCVKASRLRPPFDARPDGALDRRRRGPWRRR